MNKIVIRKKKVFGHITIIDRTLLPFCELNISMNWPVFSFHPKIMTHKIQGHF